jgi:hypothetical protein
MYVYINTANVLNTFNTRSDNKVRELATVLAMAAVDRNLSTVS